MNQKKIDKIIVKLIENTISETESELLKQWLQEEENLNYFNDFIEVNHLANSLSKFPYQSSLQEVLNASTNTPNKTTTYYKYAIAASIAVLLGITYFFINNQNSHSGTQHQIVVDSTIEIGSDKATLTLEDGTEIALEKGQEYVSNNLSSNGEELVYKAAEDENKEIAYNYLTIPRGGQYFVKLSDGTQVWLNSESQLKYPVAFTKGAPREVELVYGEAYFDVSPSTKHDGSKFRVLNQTQEIEVLGTEFNLKAYKDEETTVTTLVEGIVKVATDQGSEILNPSQQSIVDSQTSAITIAQANIKQEIAWVKGDFVFKKLPLKDIMKTISRWYDIDVVFENKDLENERFIGELSRNQSIEEILNLIKNTKIISDYEIKDKTVILK